MYSRPDIIVVCVGLRVCVSVWCVVRGVVNQRAKVTMVTTVHSVFTPTRPINTGQLADRKRNPAFPSRHPGVDSARRVCPRDRSRDVCVCVNRHHVMSSASNSGHV